MELEKAKEILTQLANGIDPTTGELFPEDSPYNHPEIIRALFIILGTSKSTKKPPKKSIEEKQKENLEKGKPRNAGLPWTDELKKEVASMYENGESIEEMAVHFERTEGAIVSELTHQGLIESS